MWSPPWRTRTAASASATTSPTARPGSSTSAASTPRPRASSCSPTTASWPTASPTPATACKKTYLAAIQGPLPRDLGKQLKNGIELEDGYARADHFKVVENTGKNYLVEVSLHEGRKHIVRRMLAEAGFPVEKLVRTSFGPIPLGDQKSGWLRRLTNTEVGMLMREVGPVRPEPVERSRRPGSLLGLALGDALGFPTEFNDVPSILATCGPWRQMELPGIRAAFVTDDTQMTLALGRGLRTAMERGPLAPLRFDAAGAGGVRRVVALPGQQPGARSHLPAAPASCSARRSVPWQEASQIGSKGCGANMRVAPARAGTRADRRPAGGRRPAPVRAHPRAPHRARRERADGARGVRCWRRAPDPAELPGRCARTPQENRTRYREDWLGDLWRALPRPLAARRSWRAAGTTASASSTGWTTRLRAPDPEADPCLVTGAGWIAEEALATGLLCFLLFPDEPVPALRRAACSSGDSDSIACLAGAFAGAHLGAGAWPARVGRADRVPGGAAGARLPVGRVRGRGSGWLG